VVMRLETGDVVIPAKDSKQLEIDALLRPKGRKVLETAYYEGHRAPVQHDAGLGPPAQGSPGSASVCTWQWLINVLLDETVPPRHARLGGWPSSAWCSGPLVSSSVTRSPRCTW